VSSLRFHLRSGRAERGAAAVEMALVLFPLMMILLGIVEFSRIFSLQLRMQQAARETAREIALHYDDPTMTGPALNALAQDTLTNLLSPTIVAGLTQSVTMCGAPTDDAVVTLISSENLAIPVYGGGTLGAVNVAARARMPCEG
jgi:Flp pilus assembly protein TadG